MLRDVLAQDPNMSDALLWLGNSLNEQGRDDDALAVLQRAVRIDPLHPSITTNLAQALMSRGRDGEAIQILENARRQPKPGYGPFLVSRLMLQRAGRLVELNALAKEQSLRGIAHHYSTALSYALLGDGRAAQFWLDRTIRDFPQFHPNVYALALVPGWQGRHSVALQSFREALAGNEIEIWGVLAFIQVWYGALLARAGEYTAAIVQLERVVNPSAPLLSQTGPKPHLDGPHALAWSYLRTGAAPKATAMAARDSTTR